MATWEELRRAEPVLAEPGRTLFYQFGVGLGFLATTSRLGAPRVHPMCPVLTEDGLFAFILPGPKCDDLLRDSRYALHSFPSPSNEDAFCLTGTCAEVTALEARGRLEAQFLEERGWTEPPPDFGTQRLFDFDIQRCLHTVTTGHGDFAPQHRVWRAPAD